MQHFPKPHANQSLWAQCNLKAKERSSGLYEVQNSPRGATQAQQAHVLREKEAPDKKYQDPGSSQRQMVGRSCSAKQGLNHT